MCLRIKPDQIQNEKNLKKWFGSRKKFAYVYKILRNYSGESFYRSIWFPDYFTWHFKEQKIYQENRPNTPTEYELSFKKINKGLHVYTSFKEAKRHQIYFGEAIVKFRANKEDIVAVNNSHREAVCTKLTFVKIIED
jgi:hypothetical protein